MSQNETPSDLQSNKLWKRPSLKPLSRTQNKGRRESITSFAGIPRKVMLSESFSSIGPNAMRVLLWLAFQYKGNNNGYLSATRQQAKNWGIGGADTLSRAISELQKHNLIARTRQGRFQNPGGSPNLYAITWESVDERTGNPIDSSKTRLPLRKDWHRRVEINSPGHVLEFVAPDSGLDEAKNE